MSKMKKLLSLSDLYDFYVDQDKSITFSSSNANSSIVVHITEPFKFEAVENNDIFLTTNLRLCHIDVNNNKSSISREAMEEAIPTAYNMPILGYIWHDDETGEDKFAGHEFYIEDGKEVYEEIPVGCIPESAELKLVENENGKTYLEGKGLIWRTYTKAADILEREENLSVSIEINIEELSFNAKDKILNINKFKFTGITILQENPESHEEIRPGMSGACITIDSFSEQNNSVFSNEDIMNKLEVLSQKFDQFSTINQNQKKGGEEQMDQNAEVNVKFEDEETSSSFDGEEFEAELEETEVEENIEVEAEAETETEVEEEVEPEPETFQKVFELSHDDIRVALYNLLTPFEEQDNEWYFIHDVYDDHFIYGGFFNEDNLWDQKYSRDGDNVAFEGDRIHMNVEFLTDNELVALNEMRSNYSAISEKLAKYEAEPEKMEILNSEDYSSISESEEFVELKKQDSHFDLSVDEVRTKADQILLNAAKSGKIEFASKEEKKDSTGVKRFPVGGKSKSSRYGNLFSK